MNTVAATADTQGLLPTKSIAVTIDEMCRKGMGMERWPPDPGDMMPLRERWRVKEGLPRNEADFAQCSLLALLDWANANRVVPARVDYLRFMRGVSVEHITYNACVPSNFTDDPDIQRLKRLGRAYHLTDQWSLSTQIRNAIEKVYMDEVGKAYFKALRHHANVKNRELDSDATREYRTEIVLANDVWAFISCLPFLAFACLHRIPPFRYLYELLMNVTALNKDQSEDIWRMAAWVVWPMMTATVGYVAYLQHDQTWEWTFYCYKGIRHEARQRLVYVEWLFYFNLFFFWLPTLALGWLVYMYLLIMIGIVFVVGMSANNLVKGIKEK